MGVGGYCYLLKQINNSLSRAEKKTLLESVSCLLERERREQGTMRRRGSLALYLFQKSEADGESV